jgi:hypothetical protein
MAAAASLPYFKIDQSGRTLLEPHPSIRYKPKELYDILMALEVPTIDGKTVTIKVRKYLNTSTTPNKDSDGGPGFVALKPLLRKVAKLRGELWNLTLGIDTPIGTDGPFGGSFFSPIPGPLTTLAPLAQAAAQGFSSYFQSGPTLTPLPTKFVTKTETLEVNNWELWRFFCGKASPPEIRRALFLAQAAGAVAPTQTALQQYCDDQGGMDCSGFASVAYGYEKATSGHEGYSASAYRTRGIERGKIENVAANDAIVWRDEGHIALVDQVGPGEDSTKIKVKVAESTAALLIPSGPGVQYSEYIIECDDTVPERRYKIHRPKSGGGYVVWSGKKITIRGNP